MTDNKSLVRGVIIGVLLTMVARSVDWLVNPGPAATTDSYLLNAFTIVVCGATAYATWRPSEGARRVLSAVSRARQ